ncbi:glycosyltransferase family 4 protein [Brevibacterium limosum]|uniref:glycosyltransferase family 4 protein n=1 Tax=Brevibacterium limosum TaxID=2697565 RepID=UPI0014203065|nr:glycosyltransferase family 4 protein [Brevibacterium limosum]
MPNGDVDAMSEAILEFLNMSENDVREMRANAIERAADFSEGAIIRRWGQVLAEQSFAPITHLKGVSAKLREAVVTADGISITAALSGTGNTFLDDAFISWKSRTGTFYGRIGADISDGTVTAEVPMRRISRITEEYVDFSLDLVARRGFTRVRISSGDGSIVNHPGQLKLYTTKHGNLSGQMLEGQGDATAEAPELTSTS